MPKTCVPFIAAVLVIGLASFAGASKERAREAMAILNWRDAVTQYAAMQSASQVGSADWDEATFGLATAYQHVQPPDAGTISESQHQYQQLISHSSDNRYIARSIMNLGRIAELRDYPDDSVDLEGARKRYLEVLKRFPDDPIASEATPRAAATLVMAYDAPTFIQVKQGVAMLESWLKDHPNDPLASLMWQYAGNAYFQPLGDEHGAMRCFESADKIGWVDPANQGPAFWRAAQLAERTSKDPKLAAKYYRRIILETPASGKAYEAALALQRLGEPAPVSPLLGDLLKPMASGATPATQPTTQPSTRPDKPAKSAGGAS